MEKSKTIVEKIKERNIKQKPKWHFAVSDILVWLIFTLSVFVGAVSFSIILFSIQQTDFSLIAHMSHSKLELFLGLFPFFWIIGLFILLVVSIFAFQKSKKGYKFGWQRLFGLSTALSMLLGTLFFIGGGSQRLEKAFAERVIYYESIQQKKKKIWMKPEEGLLSGTIGKISGDTFELTDFNNKNWNIDYGGAFIPPIIFLEKGEQVKLIGEMTGANAFYAKEIRPWDGMNHQKKRMMRRRINK